MSSSVFRIVMRDALLLPSATVADYPIWSIASIDVGMWLYVSHVCLNSMEEDSLIRAWKLRWPFQHSELAADPRSSDRLDRIHAQLAGQYNALMFHR